jgi:hypothetical protein
LQQGRTYVAFDWLADATGTTFVLTHNGKEYNIGDRVPFAPGMKLHAEIPLNARLRLMCDSKVVQSKIGNTLDAPITRPGVYRLEALLPVAGEQRPWIYTGAIRIL